MGHISLPLHKAPNFAELQDARTARDPHLLGKLAHSPNHGVAKLVAANEYTPSYVLVPLTHHKSKSVREAVAANRNTPYDMLSLLRHDPAIRVREAALQTIASLVTNT